MASTKTKGDLAELMVAADLVGRGFKLAFPYGEDSDFDLILCRDDALERVQVKHTRSDGHILEVRCESASLTNGRVMNRKRYTARTVEWIAVYDATTERCYYVPAEFLGEGRSRLSLRLTPPRNAQRRKIRWAADYTEPTPRRSRQLMEPAGLEPAASGLQTRRSPS